MMHIVCVIFNLHVSQQVESPGTEEMDVNPHSPLEWISNKSSEGLLKLKLFLRILRRFSHSFSTLRKEESSAGA